MSSSALFDEEILRRVGETVDAKLRGGNLTPFAMRPSRGFLSLGMRDVRSSPPPVPKDAGQRAINRAHADAQKKRKDAKAAKRKKHILAREALDKHRRQQRKDGLPLEESSSTSLSTEASDGNDKGEGGRGPLDHLPDVVEVVPGASASSPAPLGRGEEADPGPAVARSGAEADTPEARALGKRTVSPVGSAAVAEQVVVEAMPPPPQRTEGAPRSAEDRPAPMDMDAMPLPPPLLLQMSWKRPMDNLPLAPLKALKASPRSSVHWVAEAQAAIQRGAASTRVDPKEPAAQGGVAEAAPTRSDGAIVPFVAEAPGASEAEAMEAPVPTTAETTVSVVGISTSAEATMAEAGAPKTTEAVIVEAGAPEVTMAVVMAARPSVQEAEM
ncbi:uncharacterized protein [Miscanthus floridulus]|uniref:uncharacterized protein n=1 Tax=Miscanthus floridulus TaxID=154761 RepID=UPI00345AABB6